MWNKPSEEELKKLPAFYETEKVATKEKIIHLHFFIGGCDWYIAEYSKKDQLFFGFAILNDDLFNAEWGYISFKELDEIGVDLILVDDDGQRLAFGSMIEVDRDLHWQPKPAREVEKIRAARGW